MNSCCEEFSHYVKTVLPKVSKMTIIFDMSIDLPNFSKVIIILIHPSSQKIYRKITKEKSLQFIQNGRSESEFTCLKNLIIELNKLISLYYENLAKKLNNPLLHTKTDWSIFKTFYNDKKPTNSTFFGRW